MSYSWSRHSSEWLLSLLTSWLQARVLTGVTWSHDPPPENWDSLDSGLWNTAGPHWHVMWDHSASCIHFIYITQGGKLWLKATGNVSITDRYSNECSYFRGLGRFLRCRTSTARCPGARASAPGQGWRRSSSATTTTGRLSPSPSITGGRSTWW